MIVLRITYISNVSSMNIKDKKAWLEYHGYYNPGGYWHDGSGHNIIWRTHGSKDFHGIGDTENMMYNNLYIRVKRALMLQVNLGLLDDEHRG